jgi:hypothetical protein
MTAKYVINDDKRDITLQIQNKIIHCSPTCSNGHLYIWPPVTSVSGAFQRQQFQQGLTLAKGILELDEVMVTVVHVVYVRGGHSPVVRKGEQRAALCPWIVQGAHLTAL